MLFFKNFLDPGPIVVNSLGRLLILKNFSKGTELGLRPLWKQPQTPQPKVKKCFFFNFISLCEKLLFLEYRYILIAVCPWWRLGKNQKKIYRKLIEHYAKLFNFEKFWSILMHFKKL